MANWGYGNRAFLGSPRASANWDQEDLLLVLSFSFLTLYNSLSIDNVTEHRDFFMEFQDWAILTKTRLCEESREEYDLVGPVSANSPSALGFPEILHFNKSFDTDSN